MDDMSRKVAEWRRIMDAHRAAGIKHVAVEDNPLLHDPDFAAVVEREQAEHDERERGQ